MIVKVNRISKSGKLWINYYNLPDTYSFKSAVKYLKKNIVGKLTFERVFDETIISQTT